MRWAAGALVGIVLLAAGVAKLTSRGWPGGTRCLRTVVDDPV